MTLGTYAPDSCYLSHVLCHAAQLAEALERSENAEGERDELRERCASQEATIALLREQLEQMTSEAQQHEAERAEVSLEERNGKMGKKEPQWVCTKTS